MNRIKVLYIAGSNRCGSTLLARLLGDLPGFFTVGEGLGHFFTGSSGDHVPCGCGMSVQDCSFWKGISFPLEADQFAARWLRLHRTPLLSSYCRLHPKQTNELLGSVRKFYETISHRSGAGVIVDSSKSPLHARLLSWVPNVDLSVIYLVRDPRSVVASSCRPKEWLPGAPPFHATTRWLGLTLGCEYLRSRAPKWRALRYEDFVKAPRHEILKIALDLGYKAAEAPFTAESMAELGPQHMLGSNPDKLKRGSTRIEEKSADLPWLVRASVSVLTAPLLWRYGYWGNGRHGQFQAVACREIAVLPEIAGHETDVDFEVRA
jgi:hypothetical protein